MNELIELNDKQRKIAELLNQGHKVELVAKSADCTIDEVLGVLSSPAYVQSVRLSALFELSGRGAKIAVDTLIEVARNKANSAQARVSASSKILEHTGLQLNASGMIDKPLSEMTAKELDDRRKELHSEAARRAKSITTAPMIDGDSVNLLD